MCKHQVNALLVKGHAGGTIVEQMGTRFGSNFDGILPPPTQVLTEVPSPTQLADHTHDHLQDELPSLQLEHEEDVAGMVDLQHTADETLFPAIQSPPPTEINPQVFHDLIAHMTELVGGNSQLFQNAVASLEQTNNNLAQMRHSQTLTGKDVTKTNDRFVKPLGLTSKRRLGVIDLYHGGKRGKRTQAHPKKRRTAKNKEVPAPSQVCPLPHFRFHYNYVPVRPTFTDLLEFLIHCRWMKRVSLTLYMQDMSYAENPSGRNSIGIDTLLSQGHLHKEWQKMLRGKFPCLQNRPSAKVDYVDIVILTLSLISMYEC